MNKNKKFIERKDLPDLIKKIKDSGKKIVLTNGAFDVLHSGHIIYLEKAKSLGDILIIGLNTDASVKSYKDPNRPINKFEDRLIVLCGLSSVDYVTPITEQRPAELIKAITPDIYVKGGDYKKDKIRSTPIVESLGGKVIIIPFVGNYSTTDLINRIKTI